MAKKMTPMMKQYYEIKSDYPDCILFFRLGDFYEMFEEDAEVGAEILDITLTARAKGENKIPMAGIPYHSAEGYIAKLTQKGKKVAICEQVSDPNEPGIVERKVVRVVTPGTNISSMSLDQKANQFVCSIAKSKEGFGMGFCDVSTGELILGEVSDFSELKSFLSAYDPKELVADPELAESPEIYSLDISANAFELRGCPRGILIEHFDVKTLNPFGIDDNDLLIEAGALLLGYVGEVMQNDLNNVRDINLLTSNDYFDLDQSTIYNLEIFHTIRDFEKKGSLISVIDKTVTACGGRLLRRWILRPLKNLEMINKRLKYVSAFMTCKEIRDLLSKTYDIERLISRLSLGYANPRDLIQIKETLSVLPEIVSLFEKSEDALSDLADKFPDLAELHDLINSAIVDEPPISKRDGGIFKDGYNKEADQYRTLLREGKSYIAKHQQDLIEQTGIQKLKVGFNKVFGYYIEVSKAKTSLVPDTFTRKQTLTNSERYITPELKEFEDKVLNAEENLKVLEEKLFDELVLKILEYSDDLNLVAKNLAFSDVTSSFAELAGTSNFIRPELHEGIDIEIAGSRHPVLEILLPSGAFVPNDVHFDNSNYVHLITGPNMGGKSTYLRQVALCVLLAQIGSYVPATRAKIGLVDQIFSRVGASDNLAKGLSTFMVEMEETAYILRNATNSSLLILDEIGRGTSTYDGVSIAWSVLEHIHNELNARTLFATHYHELIQVVDNLEHASNLSVAVKENQQGEATFLHTINEGAVNKSYGVHVAKRAGLPDKVVNRAVKLLNDLEEDIMSPGISKELAESRAQQDIETPKLFVLDEQDNELRKRISGLDINKLTPLEALQELGKLKEDFN